MTMGDGRDLPLRFFLQPGERQIFEHHARQLVQRHLDFVGQLAGLIPCLAVTLAIPIPALPSQEITWFSRPLSHAFLRLPVLEAILLQVAQRDSDAFLPIRGNDRLLGDQFTQVLTDRLLDTLVVPQAILQTATAQFLRRCHDYFSRASKLLTYFNNSLAHSEQYPSRVISVSTTSLSFRTCSVSGLRTEMVSLMVSRRSSKNCFSIASFSFSCVVYRTSHRADG